LTGFERTNGTLCNSFLLEGGTATGSVFAFGVDEGLTLRLSFGMEGAGAGAATAIAREEIQ